MTPRTSSPVIAYSEQRPAVLEDLTISDDQDEENHTDASNSTDADSDGSESSSANEGYFQTVRKRIKGVLPASWLRFDSEAKPAANNAKRKGISARADSSVIPGRGIAQRRTDGRSGLQSVPIRFDDFSDDDDDDDTQATPVRNVPSISDVHPTQSIGEQGFESDEMEDKAVDGMLPASARKQQVPRKQRKKQAKIRDHFTLPRISSKSGANGRNSSSAHRDQAKGRRRKPTKRRDSPRHPALSVLDMHQEKEDVTVTPPFLKLAKRQARQQQHYGRQSPTRKIVRLATRIDTEDAVSTLTAWKTGQMKQRALPPVARAPSQKRGPPRPGGNVPSLPQLTRRTNAATTSHQQPRIDSRFQPRQAQPPSRGAPPEANGSHERPQKLVGKTRQWQSNTRNRELFRPAQLEADDHRPRFNLTSGKDSLTFYKRAMQLDGQPRAQQQPSFQLQRFLDNLAAPDHAEILPPSADLRKPSDTVQTAQQTTRRLKKVAPRRLSVDTEVFRQPDVVLPVAVSIANPINTDEHAQDGLQGLDTGDGHFSVDFDIRPLAAGTYFHSSTFLGSGDFAKVLALKQRNLNDRAGYITIKIDDQDTQWSVWSEETASWLSSIRCICDDAFRYMATSNDEDASSIESAMGTTTYLLRSLVRYVSSCFHLSDPVDRISFVHRFQRFLEDMTDSVTLRMKEAAEMQRAKVRIHLVDCSLFIICLLYQQLALIRQAPHAAPDPDAVILRLRQMCFLATQELFADGCESLRAFGERWRHHSIRDAGAKDDEVAVKFIVIADMILKDVKVTALTLDTLVAELWRHKLARVQNINQLDMVWYDVASIQPIFALDTAGLCRAVTSNSYRTNCWSIVKALLERTFHLYGVTPESKGVCSAAYLRTIFSRVNLFLTKWEWGSPDAVLATMYDFFAGRGLAHLPRERPGFSPDFLQHLDQQDTNESESTFLTIGQYDLAYHAFLKVLANGLRVVSKEYPESSVKRIAFRFIPNHGRTYRKDQNVRKTDLDSLRNHHDLLCTLHWALPAGSRPRLTYIRDLVEYSTSHLEACRINMEAWRNMAVFIMSSQAQQQETTPLAMWFKEFTGAMVSQFRLARSEAEELLAMSNNKSGSLSYDIVQMNVTSNQTRILETLRGALDGMQRALDGCTVPSSSLRLVTESDLVAVFRLLDAEQSRTFAPVLQVLNLVKKLLNQPNTQSEESQEYGDWDGLFMSQTEKEDSDDEVTAFQPAVHQLLSNCFGADDRFDFDDGLLETLTDVWCTLAARTVQKGNRSWSQYLDDRGTFSWFDLQHTNRQIKYTPLMLAHVLRADRSSLQEHQEVILTRWLVTLVEREATMKFQHRLTSALLNAQTGSPLLHDLPFAIDTRTEQYDVTLAELKSSRIALLSCVLSNMRLAVATGRADLKREYNAMLREMARAMKASYQSLTSNAGDTSAKGSYVAFVQQVVSLLQQHTTDFNSVDAFFTDPSVFPLPSDDPNYIVGRLKSYSPKLGEDRERKKFVILLQTLLSNACGGGTQLTLCAQLVAASLPTTDVTQDDGALRIAILSDILPAYFSLVQTVRGAALLATPLVEAVGVIVDRLRFHVNFEAAPQKIVWAMETAVSALSVVITQLLSESGAASLASEQLAFVTAAYDAAALMLTTVDYAARCGPGKAGLKSLEAMYELTRRHGNTLDTVPTVRLSGLAGYARTNLQELLGQQWRWTPDGFRDSMGRRVAAIDGTTTTWTHRAKESMSSFKTAWEAIVLGLRSEAADGLAEMMI